MNELHATDKELAIGRAPADEYNIEGGHPDLLLLISRSTGVNITIRLPVPSPDWAQHAFDLAVTGGRARTTPPSRAISAFNELISRPTVPLRVSAEICARDGLSPINKQLWSARCPVDAIEDMTPIVCINLTFSIEPTRTAVAIDHASILTTIETYTSLSEEEEQCCEEAAGWLCMDLSTECGLAIREWAARSTFPVRLLWGMRHLANHWDETFASIRKMSPARRIDMTKSIDRFATRSIQLAHLYPGKFGREIYEEAKRLLDLSIKAKAL